MHENELVIPDGRYCGSRGSYDDFLSDVTP
jgi:hypothetical protein